MSARSFSLDVFFLLFLFFLFFLLFFLLFFSLFFLRLCFSSGDRIGVVAVIARARCGCGGAR